MADQVEEPTTTQQRLGLGVGLATGIGSLPHVDPGEAVDFVLRHLPRLPAAPSLPARSRREGIIAQAATGVAGIEVCPDGSLTIDDAALDPEATLAPDWHATDAYVGQRAFINALSERRGPIKLSLCGPVTFGVALHAAGVPARQAFRIAGATTRQRARDLLDLLDARLPSAHPVVFVDEPVLGSAMFPDFPIGPVESLDLTSSVLAVLEPRAVTGLHCCGRADWKLLLDAGPQILSLPTTEGIEDAAASVAQFLDRGGWVAWGAVPTDGPIGTTVERLWRQLSLLWCTLVTEGSCDPVRLRTQAMITPACGLFHHGVPQAEQVATFTTRMAERLLDQAIGVRLQVGA